MTRILVAIQFFFLSDRKIGHQRWQSFSDRRSSVNTTPSTTAHVQRLRTPAHAVMHSLFFLRGSNDPASSLCASKKSYVDIAICTHRLLQWMHSCTPTPTHSHPPRPPKASRYVVLEVLCLEGRVFSRWGVWGHSPKLREADGAVRWKTLMQHCDSR